MQIENDLTFNYQPLEIYRKYQLDQYMAGRTFQTWAREFRDANQQQIVHDRQRFLNNVLETLGIDTTDQSTAHRIAYATLMSILLTEQKSTAKLNAVQRLMEMNSDKRKDEQHRIKCKLAELQEKSETDDSGRKVVSMEEVAKLLRAIDMDED